MIRAIKRAVKITGSQTRLARYAGVTPSMVSQWVSGHRPLTPARCPQIEAATDGEVRCEELCPEVTWHRGHDGRVIGYTVPVDSADAREVA